MKQILLLQTKTHLLLIIGVFLVAHYGNAQEEARSVEINLSKNQVVSFITSKPLPGSDTKRSEYFSRVFPAAQEKGYTQHGSFVIQSVNLHGFNVESHVGQGNLMSFFSWPNSKSIEKFRTETPDWPELEKMRRDIWEELRIVRMTLGKDASLEFREDKIYRLVLVWRNKDNPKNLDKYQNAMKDTRESLGSRYVVKWDKVDYYHSFTSPSEAPDEAWIIEWPTSDAHTQYLQSQAFKDNVQNFMSGVSKFEAYEVGFQF